MNSYPFVELLLYAPHYATARPVARTKRVTESPFHCTDEETEAQKELGLPTVTQQRKGRAGF